MSLVIDEVGIGERDLYAYLESRILSSTPDDWCFDATDMDVSKGTVDVSLRNDKLGGCAFEYEIDVLTVQLTRNINFYVPRQDGIGEGQSYAGPKVEQVFAKLRNSIVGSNGPLEFASSKLPPV